MLACGKRFKRYLLDTPQKLVIGKGLNLHQHANLTFESKCHNPIRRNKSVQNEPTCIFVAIAQVLQFSFDIVPRLGFLNLNLSLCQIC